MEIKNQPSAKPLLLKVMAIIILFFLFWLATYIWIHHQTLSQTEEEIISLKKEIKSPPNQNE